ncbi:MAG: hypothetical protein KC417_01205, partial [Myxococcales bacterium]|nr:hypothetical protein [Myxococcales bacterium]
DDDNDGVPTLTEGPDADTDNDQTPNYLDADDDGDGVLTSAECPMPSACVDHDGDGVPDYLDLCGDTHITGTEACDDGNDDADDGCAASCLLEAGEACTTNGECDLGRCDTGSSSVCVVCFDDHADTTTDDGCGGAAKFCNTAPAGHACVECFDASLCDDTNDCTDDACAAGACTHTNNSDACDDGDLCTTADTCAGGACAGSAVNCDDGLGCTTEMCNGATGSCAVSVGTGCAIEGACWTAGATKPGNTCLECNTALSTVHWSVATGCTGCTSDADCSGATGVCDTGSGVCVQCLAGKTTACVGASPICSLAAAVCSACVSDAECQARDSSAPVCAGSGACVECTSNAQCNDDALCAVASGTCIPFDFDGDGINDADDADSDNDGILDVDEGHGVDPSADTDHDGVPDYLDEDHAGFVDENGDGVDDRFDTDGDGHPDHLDLDADGDGIPDIVEAGGVDADGDGRVDDDTDADVDGLADLVDPSEGGTPWTLPDTDGDGKKDFQDTDSDNDGISDLVEAHDFDGDGKADVVPENNDTDGDGWDDAFDGAGLDAPPDSDGDGKPNYQDVDDDGDGVLTKDERTDSNGNGIPDYLEGDVHGGDVDAGDDAGVDGGSPQTGSLAGGALCTTQAGTRNPGAPALLLVMATCLGLARRRRRP